MCEAFNVANETGKTPRQLVDDVSQKDILLKSRLKDIKELEKQNKELIKAMRRVEEEFMGVNINYIGGPRFESLVLLQQAIKKAES